MRKIETIFTHGPGRLGIDENGNLYWNGKPVVTESSLNLKWWVDCSVIVGAISTAIIAVFTALIFYATTN